MALTSGIYRLAPSDGYLTREEGERRLKATLRRLVERYGQPTVLARIRAYPGDSDVKAWLVLTVYAVERRATGS